MRLPVLLACTLGAALLPAADLLEANRDPAIPARTDFWRHANARWNAAHPLAEDRASYYSYDWLDDLVRADVLGLHRDLLTPGRALTPEQRKIADFWRSALAFEHGPAELPPPVRAILDRLDQAATPQALLEIAADLAQAGVGSYVGVGADQDARNEHQVVVLLGQSGLSLPEKSYYLDAEPEPRRVREAFPAHVARLLAHLGYAPNRATAAARDILAFETRLAEVSRALEDLEDPEKNYHKLSLAELDALAPGLRWAEVLRRAGAPATTHLVVGQPEFITGLGRILATTPAATVRDYLRFQAIAAFADVLNGQTAADAFIFEGTVLSGAKRQRSLEERALKIEDGAIGDLVGREYVARHFSAAQRERFRAVTENVRAVFAERLRANPWMDAPTREWALRKLAAVKPRVGYADKWRLYEGAAIGPGRLADNLLAVHAWNLRREFARVGGEPEREEWGMRPYTVNAYYNPLNNEIVLPAAILSAPGYAGAELDDAVLYGYIATTIGHELTHGFDDAGRHYGATGRLEEGWSTATEAAFRTRCEKLIASYEREEPLPGMRVNGRLTLSENIADLGGVELALDAFMRTDAYRSGRLVDGQTPLQRFFLAYAFSFAGQVRPETLGKQLRSDTHAPAIQRINVVLRHTDRFHEAFGTRPGDAMWLDPAERVRIW
jgi:putative endopeptidase